MGVCRACHRNFIRSTSESRPWIVFALWRICGVHLLVAKRRAGPPIVWTKLTRALHLSANSASDNMPSMLNAAGDITVRGAYRPGSARCGDYRGYNDDA